MELGGWGPDQGYASQDFNIAEEKSGDDGIRIRSSK